jgi:glycosyltransferase involved in cell wall biosynthesis
MSGVLFLLPRANMTSTPIRELIERHDAYLKYFTDDQTGERPLNVCMLAKFGQNELQGIVTKNLKLVSLGAGKYSFFTFPFKTILLLKKMNFNPKWIVSGDANITLIFAFLIKYFYARRSKLQVSFHGEFQKLTIRNPKKIAEYFLLRLLASEISLYRFVSQSQLQQYTGPLKIKSKKVIVVPIPIQVNQYLKERVGKRSLGFVGRIHQERGVQEWIDISKRIGNCNLIVAGDGPLKQVMENLLPQAKFLGHIPSSKMTNVWQGITVLLSCAPTESYGLAIREALLHGVPVVSRANLGSLEISSKFPSIIKTYSSLTEAVDLIEMLFGTPPKSSEFEKFRTFFSFEQEFSLRSLARVWSNDL